MFLGHTQVEDPEQLKYLNILFDFAYLRNPEEFENKINSDVELLDVDDEFFDNHEDILDRFYQLFDGIYKVSSVHGREREREHAFEKILKSLTLKLLQIVH